MDRKDCLYKNVCTLDCPNYCIRYEELNFLISTSQLPKLSNSDLIVKPTNDNDAREFTKLKKIKDNILDFVNKGKSVYICGNSCGNGKTTWAIKLLLKYFDKIWEGNGFEERGLFIHVPSLLLKLKDFNSDTEELRQKIINTDLVIFDDIATNMISQYDYSQLLTLIDNRVLNKKASIYTSNVVDKDKLAEIIGNRLVSRIYNTSEVCIFTGNDMRGKNGTSSNNK